MALVALTGGASRADAQSLVLLRPIAAIAIAWSLFSMPQHAWRQALAPLVLLLGMAIIAGIQLIPLPPGLWTSLPGRDLIAAVDVLLFGDPVPRPITLSPAATWNSLFSLLVPCAALLLFVRIDGRKNLLLFAILTGIALLSGIFALVQVASPDALKLYAIHSPTPTGLFANANHQAVFSALGIVWAAYLAQQRFLPGDAFVNWSSWSGVTLLLLGATIVTGSRAGLIAVALALLVSAWLFLLGRQGTANVRIARLGSLAVLAGFALALSIVFLATTSNGPNLPAVEVFMAGDPLGDLRFRALPTIVEMLKTYFPLGSGLGSFAPVFMLHEPDSLITAKYMNQAHNDLLQLALEGGLPAIALFLGIVIWVAAGLLRLFRAPEHRSLAVTLLGAFGIVLLASAVDYPLRTPLFASAMALLLVPATARDDLRRKTR